MQEAIDFAVRGKVRAMIETTELENINEVFKRMEEGKINGRIVLTLE